MSTSAKNKTEDRTNRAFLESLPGPALEIDDDGSIRAVNNRLLELTGLGEAELAGSSDWGSALFPGVEHPIPFAPAELRLRGAGGAERLVRPHLLTPPGPGRVAWLEDLTERRRLENDLAERRRYEQTLGALSQILLRESGSDQAVGTALSKLLIAAKVCRTYLYRNTTDSRGRLCYTQVAEATRPGVRRIIDATRGELKPYRERIPRWVEILTSGDSIKGLTRDFPAPEQAILRAEDTVSILVLPIFVNDQWDGFIGFDLTTEPRIWSQTEVDALRAAAAMIGAYAGRERTLAAAASSEEKLRLVVDEANVAIFIFQNNRFRFVNNAAAALTGRSKKELLSGNQSLFCHPDDYSIIVQRMRYREAGLEVSKDLIHRVITPWGEIRWVEVSSAQSNWEGAPAVISFAQDITKRHEAEQERARLEKQLRQARKMESLGTLAGGIAHDFNNILQAISGHVELITESGEPGPQSRELLGKINQAVDRAGSLVRRILTFSRKLEPSWQAVDLNDLVMETARLVGPALPKMISIEFELTPEQPLIWADPDQAAQIILNLGTNAGDAMPEGGRLTFKTSVVNLADEKGIENLNTPAQKFAVLTASDTGTGMDEDTLDNIFDPFFTTKPRGRGAGLGLATVHGIIESHNGAVSVRSTKGVGSEFIVFLPMVASDRVAAKPDPKTEETDLTGRETILITDDEPTIRDVLAAFFTGQGYTVETADDGEQALEVFKDRGQGIDLVIMDLSMPGMGGYKASLELRRINPEVKLIIASGYSPDTDKIKDLLDESEAAFVAKPFRMHKLLQTARRLLDK